MVYFGILPLEETLPRICEQPIHKAATIGGNVSAVIVAPRRKSRMRFALVALFLPLGLSGCLSFSSSDPPPPAHNTTIVAPPASTR
jgi:hypothetical protein